MGPQEGAELSGCRIHTRKEVPGEQQACTPGKGAPMGPRAGHTGAQGAGRAGGSCLLGNELGVSEFTPSPRTARMSQGDPGLGGTVSPTG